MVVGGRAFVEDGAVGLEVGADWSSRTTRDIHRRMLESINADGLMPPRRSWRTNPVSEPEQSADVRHAERREAIDLPRMNATAEGRAMGEGGISPCRGTCNFDVVARLCIDCGRLAREIREWPGATLQRRQEICNAAALRIAADRCL